MLGQSSCSSCRAGVSMLSCGRLEGGQSVWVHARRDLPCVSELSRVTIVSRAHKEDNVELSWGEGLTFSNPKNLSLPSSRTGPAFCSSFSTGVRSGCGSSFLFLADAVLSDFEAPWKCNCQSGTGVPRCREHVEGPPGWEGECRCRGVWSCAPVCVCVYMCACAPRHDRRVQLTEPAPLSFWKNPAMASAAETRRPGRYSAGRDGYRGGGSSRRGGGRSSRGGGSLGEINATEGWGGGGGWRWRQRRQFGGNHPAGRGRAGPAVVRDTRRNGRGWRRLGLGGRAHRCGGTIQVAQSLEVSARRGSRRAGVGDGEAWACVGWRGQASVGRLLDG